MPLPLSTRIRLFCRFATRRSECDLSAPSTPWFAVAVEILRGADQSPAPIVNGGYRTPIQSSAPTNVGCPSPIPLNAIAPTLINRSCPRLRLAISAVWGDTQIPLVIDIEKILDL